MEKTNRKKVLATSIVSWSELSGGDTMASLLDGYGSENVASIYVRGNDPTSNCCDNYFRINEASVLKSIFKRNIVTGWKQNRKDVSKAKQDEAEQKRYSFFNKYRLFIFLFLRELGWKFGKWNSKELNEFIDNFKPQVLLCAVEPYIYMNRVNLYIAKKTNAKVISIIWDDNFTYKSCTGLSDKFFRFFVKRQAKKILSMSDKVLAITPKTKAEVDEYFNVDSVIITKSILNPQERKEESIKPKFPLKFLYAGNLYIGRDKSLALLSSQIKAANKDSHYFDFDIYVNNMPEEKVKKSIENEYTTIFGHINKEELNRKISESDILVFAESLDRKYAYASRLSFSTKIVDYLSAGKAILAIGKSDTAVMEYFRDNDAAFCVSNREEIFDTLKIIAENSDVVSKYSKNAYSLGEKNHNKEATTMKLQKMIEEL